MSKNRTLFALVLVCLLLPLMAQATITRVIGLGGPGTNYVVKDAFNPTLWPQLILDYPNLAGGEFYTPANGGWGFQKAYINYGFPDEGGVLQFSLDRLPGIHSQFSTMDEATGITYNRIPAFPDVVPGVDENASKLSVIYGRRMADFKVGGQLTFAGQSYKTSGTNSTELSASLIGVNLGLSAMQDKLDLALGFETVGFKNTAGGTVQSESDGSMALNITGRYWWDVNTRYAIIPNIRFLTLKDAAKNSNASASNSITDIKLGVGNNWTPVDNALAIFEVGIDMYSDKAEQTQGGVSGDVTTKANAMPYWRIGFESQIFGWLNGRLGAERGWVSFSSDDTNAGEPEGGFSTTNTYLGATAHWNRLILDLLVEPTFIQNGPYFVSGQGNALFSRVSLKYDFNQ